MRWPLRPTSFRARIAVAALVTSCLALLVAGSIFFVRQWSDDRQQLLANRTVQARVMAANLTAPLLADDRASAHARLESARNIPDFEVVRLFHADGRLLAESRRAGVAVNPSFLDVTQPQARFSRDRLEIHMPVGPDQARLGELVMVLGVQHLQDLLRDYVGFVLLLLLIVAGAAGLMSYWLSGRVIEPVNRLSRAIRQVRDSGDFSVTVEASSDDELGRLTEDFNELLRTLQRNSCELSLAMAQLLEARDASEAANTAKSHFLANMSHEIRTPLNAVLGMAQVMARDPLDETQRGRLDVIRTSGQGLLSLLNDLLDLSKIEAERLDLDETEFDLAKLIASACDPFVAVAGVRDLPLHVVLDDGAQGVWLGDPARVRQIISNLVSNAVKFTRVGEVVVRASVGPTGLAIAVRDTGVGVPAEKLPLLFEKFSQADTSVTREFGGTGLGLAITRQLVRLMGGEIEVTSVEGQGSTFAVTLPLARLRDAAVSVVAEPGEPTAVETGPDAPQDDDSGRNVRILAAEDNPTNQLVLHALLEPLGADLTMVGNGAEAVEAWAHGAFDLILMDIQMPLVDGISATREIREGERARGAPPTPIVALTANAMKHQVTAYLEAGMNAHVAKPIEAELLYATIVGLLSEQEAQAVA